MSSPISNARSGALLTPDEMAHADRRAIERGQTGLDLMRRAAAAVARAAADLSPEGAIAILAGSGNNGGDAFAAAAILKQQRREVAVYALSPRSHLSGDARVMAEEWTGPVGSLEAFAPDGFSLVIDGLFGAGLSRDVEGAASAAIRRLNGGNCRVLAIDLPSGVSGDDGQVKGAAVKADRTVTFFRRKPGHLLQPGRRLCGEIEVADIGIDASVLDEIAPRAFANEPALFMASLPKPEDTHHKYDRGHVVVFSGGATQTGAARLAAMAALRGGAGLATLFSPPSALLVNASHLTAIMLRRCEGADDLAAHLEDERLSTFMLGPGFGDLPAARAYAEAILRAGRSLVLDADAITAFADDPDALFALIRDTTDARVALTPHEGEFSRLFPDLAEGPSKLDRARGAANRAGAVVVLKGSDTVIAAPDGRAAINGNGPASLATAGSGDVLSGLVAAQFANGVPAFEAACAAVWLHAEAAAEFGPGLIAEDLPALVPRALARLGAAR